LGMLLMVGGVLADDDPVALAVPVELSAGGAPAPASRTVPSGVCDTASCRLCPGVSATSDITSIASPAIAICTRFSATLSTCASTTVPGCNTTGDVALPVGCAAMTGRLGLMVSAMGATLTRPT